MGSLYIVAVASGTSTSTTSSAVTHVGHHGNMRHRETQLQLQRKLQQRELLREQKRKLEQQRSEIEAADNDSRDSLNSSDSSRDGFDKSFSGISAQGKVLAAKGTRGGSAEKCPKTPLTPQKLILPKTLNKLSPVRSGGKSAEKSGASQATTNAVVNGVQPCTATAGDLDFIFINVSCSCEMKFSYIGDIHYCYLKQKKGYFPGFVRHF